VGQAQFCNNIYADPGGSGGNLNGWGNYRTNPQALSLSDYNLNPSSGVAWVLSQNASPGTAINTFSSYATFSAALAANGGISGAEAHSITGVPTFVGTGIYASQYKLTSGSAGHNAGSTTCTTGGAACDMGAWGGASPPTQIGCDFGGGVATPRAPQDFSCH